MPAADTRLVDFVDWASANGVPASRIGDFRRIAEELLTLSGSARVTESHILRLFDTYADRPGGRVAVTLIEEVGEAMLRHESSRKLAMASASQSPAPAAPAPAPVIAESVLSPQPVPTPPPRSSARRAAETFTARPDERISVELRPPSVPREPSVPPHVVSFAPTPDQPIAPLTSVPSSSTTSQSRRHTSSQFRCLRCKTMVAPDETGVCPRCGSSAPRISSTQIATVPPPNRARWWLPVALTVAAFTLAFRYGPDLIDRVRHPSQPVAGTSDSPHLGVRLAFPEGWRHATDGDRAPTSTASGFQAVIPEPVSLRSAHYFRGSPRNPVAELMLSVAPRPPHVTDEIFQGWASSAAAAPATLAPTLRELSGVSGLQIDRCVVGQAVPGGGLRCVGQASRTRALVFAWPGRTVTAVAVFLSAENPDAALEEANTLIAGLDLS